MIGAIFFYLFGFVLYFLSSLLGIVHISLFSSVGTVLAWFLAYLLPWGGYFNLAALYAVLMQIVEFYAVWYVFQYILVPFFSVFLGFFTKQKHGADFSGYSQAGVEYYDDRIGHRVRKNLKTGRIKAI